MLKLSTFSAETPEGPRVIPLFGAADAVFEKTAAPGLLPDVTRYIESLRPRKDAQYVLVNALGASEYFGSNINGDAFPEASLLHRPDDWTGNPLLDAIHSKGWPYGYPTFYNAHPYAHHRNKDKTRAFGEVELACWNPGMKRVELVTRLDREKCHAFGGVQVWDKIQAGLFPDVSMGTRVPFDVCSICLDWNTYRKAQATFIAGKDKHPGDAVLRWHRRDPIRGVSITRKDYCVHARTQMNRILPDGRKVWVFNDYPSFFDISFVFIGADRTAKTMLKIASGGRVYLSGSAEEAEKLGYDESDEALLPAFYGEKTAGAKVAREKEGEIVKDVLPSQFTGKAVPLLTRHEEDIPESLLDVLRHLPLADSLSTTAGMGIVLRPHEFEHVTQGAPPAETPLGPEHFRESLARLLLPLLLGRSALGPYIERRLLVVVGRPPSAEGGAPRKSSSLSALSLRKMASAYTDYRHRFMELVPHSQDLLGEFAGPHPDLQKLSSAAADKVFTPLAVAYIQGAFLDELPAGISKIAQAKAIVERGCPSRNTLSAFTRRRSS